MPANIPFIPERISQFVDQINEFKTSAAEKALAQATRGLSATISPMKGAERQHVSVMEVPAGEARLLELFTRLLSRGTSKPLKAIDVGTFTGHSAGAIAKGMLKGGTVITCDLAPEVPESDFREIARRYWDQEGVADRVDYRLGPAAQTLNELASREAGTFDLVFIDADKTGYGCYYDMALTLLRSGGLVILDNMLWSGKVANPDDSEPTTLVLRSLSESIARDVRVRHILLDAEDGIMIAEKLDSEPLELTK